MDNFYVSRKATIVRFIISMMICAVSVVFADDSDFRMFIHFKYIVLNYIRYAGVNLWLRLP